MNGCHSYDDGWARRTVHAAVRPRSPQRWSRGADLLLPSPRAEEILGGELCQPALPAHLLPLSATKLSPLLTPVRVFLDVNCPTGKPPALWGYFN